MAVETTYIKKNIATPDKNGNPALLVDEKGVPYSITFETIAGPQGPKGDKGDKGDVGPSPTIGENGNWFIDGVQTIYPSRGEKGEQGVQGEKGETGPRGEQGKRGVTGEQGPVGPAGPKGDTGSRGPMGQQGPPGVTGPAGPQGNIGPQGPPGVEGPQGLQGAQGLQGPKGDPGQSLVIRGIVDSISELPEPSITVDGTSYLVKQAGVTGKYDLYILLDSVWTDTGDFTSIPGEQGPAGATGPQGPPGEQGLQGEQGLRGEQGPAGPTGPAGADGITPHIDEATGNWFLGTSDTQIKARGDVGPIGPQGPQGLPGKEGPIGPPGDTGPIGPQGPQGLPGEPGKVGPQGGQGKQGDKGAKGDQGVTGYGIYHTTFEMTIGASALNIPRTTITPTPTEIKVGDQLIANNGVMGIVTDITYSSETVKVNTYAKSLRGPKGDPGTAGTQIFYGSTPQTSVKFNSNPQIQLDTINEELNKKLDKTESTLQFNQIFSSSSIYDKSVIGVTLVNNQNGSFTLTGTFNTTDNIILTKPIKPIYSDHLYYCDVIGTTDKLLFGYYHTLPLVVKGDYSLHKYKFSFTTHNHESGESINITGYPMIIDLTEMFGKGKEPSTIEEVQKYIKPNTYYPYTPIKASIEQVNSLSALPDWENYIENVFNFSSSGTKIYIAPSNGWIRVNIKNAGSSSPVISLYKNDIYLTGVPLISQGINKNNIMAVSKGQEIRVEGLPSSVDESSYSRFFYSKEV